MLPVTIVNGMLMLFLGNVGTRMTRVERMPADLFALCAKKGLSNLFCKAE